MPLKRRKAQMDNLGKEFLDDDPQQGVDAQEQPELRTLTDAVDERDAEDPELINFPPQYESDTLLSDSDEEGPLDNEFLAPAPSQVLGADEESGGLYGSTADEVLGDDGPDGRDLGDIEDDYGQVERGFGGTGSGAARDRVPLGDIETTEAREDRLNTDRKTGGTYGDIRRPVVDSETGELTDYDDEETPAKNPS